MSDQEAFEPFAHMRWGSLTNVVCPKCGVRHEAYFLKTRKQWVAVDRTKFVLL